MENFDKNTIKKLTQLSRIACTEQEEKALAEDLRKILRYVDQMQDIDTEHVEPCNHVLSEIVNVMREDHVDEVLSCEEFLANAPARAGGFIKVPPVLRKK